MNELIEVLDIVINKIESDDIEFDNKDYILVSLESIRYKLKHYYDYCAKIIR